MKMRREDRVGESWPSGTVSVLRTPANPPRGASASRLRLPGRHGRPAAVDTMKPLLSLVLLGLVTEIAGAPLSPPNSDVRIWQISDVAQIDLIAMANGTVQLTCRRPPRASQSSSAARLQPRS